VLSLAHEQIAAGRKSLSLAQLMDGRAYRDQVSDLSTQARSDACVCQVCVSGVCEQGWCLLPALDAALAFLLGGLLFGLLPPLHLALVETRHEIPARTKINSNLIGSKWRYKNLKSEK
jgi:hypothetical protein